MSSVVKLLNGAQSHRNEFYYRQESLASLFEIVQSNIMIDMSSGLGISIYGFNALTNVKTATGRGFDGKVEANR